MIEGDPPDGVALPDVEPIQMEIEAQRCFQLIEQHTLAVGHAIAIAIPLDQKYLAGGWRADEEIAGAGHPHGTRPWNVGGKHAHPESGGKGDTLAQQVQRELGSLFSQKRQ